MQGNRCPCGTEGQHSFQSYLVATLTPDRDQLCASDVENFTSPQSIKVIVESLTSKRYLIACSKCGATVGGYAASRAMEVQVDEGQSASSDSSASSIDE